MKYEMVVDSTDISSYQLGLREKLSEYDDIDKLVVPAGYIDGLTSDKLCVIIDFPYGISSTDLRVKEIEYAAKNGAKWIDLVISQRWLIDKNIENIYEDLLECKKVCLKNNLELRTIIEYRLIKDRVCVEVAKIIDNAGISTVILGGTMQDNLIDLAELLKELSKHTDLEIIAGVSEFTDETITSLFKRGISGIRRRFLNIFS